MGFAVMGTASATGEGAALEAARKAIACPLLEEGGLKGARAVLLNMTASSSLALHEMQEACELIRTATENPEVQINFGLVPDEDLGDEVKITVIATGFERTDLPQVDAPAVSGRIQAPRAFSSEPTPVRAVPSTPLFDDEPELAGDHVFDQIPISAGEAAGVIEIEAAEPQIIDQQPAPAEAVFDLDFAEPPPRLAERPAAPAQASPAEPQAAEDVFDFDDIDTPAFLKRERKLFQ
jgi:cell division protein FtsZ